MDLSHCLKMNRNILYMFLTWRAHEYTEASWRCDNNRVWCRAYLLLLLFSVINATENFCLIYMARGVSQKMHWNSVPNPTVDPSDFRVNINEIQVSNKFVSPSMSMHAQRHRAWYARAIRTFLVNTLANST